MRSIATLLLNGNTGPNRMNPNSPFWQTRCCWDQRLEQSDAFLNPVWHRHKQSARQVNRKSIVKSTSTVLHQYSGQHTKTNAACRKAIPLVGRHLEQCRVIHVVCGATLESWGRRFWRSAASFRTRGFGAAITAAPDRCPGVQGRVVQIDAKGTYDAIQQGKTTGWKVDCKTLTRRLQKVGGVYRRLRTWAILA